MMKFPIKAIITLDTEINNEDLQIILTPENETPDGTGIITRIVNDRVVTEIEGKMKVSTLLRSLDDIIQTIILAENVSKSTETPDQQE